MSQVQPYQFEPEYSSGEELEEEHSSEESDGELARAGRIGRTSWCQCECCAAMPTEHESICCKEQSFLSTIVIEIPCVTLHDSFQAVCLNRDVLWTALVCLHDRESAGLPNRNEVTNRSYRYASYRQFTWWVHGWLGKQIHRVIPSCAVKKIRRTFPEEDGVYTGYKQGDDDDSEMDNEIEQAWRDFL